MVIFGTKLIGSLRNWGETSKRSLYGSIRMEQRDKTLDADASSDSRMRRGLSSGLPTLRLDAYREKISDDLPKLKAKRRSV